MGYTAPHREYQLPLGTEFAGLEVTVTGVSIGEYLAIAGFTEGVDRSISYAFDEFCKNLVAWNLETENGEPIPVTAAADQDKELMLALTAAWVDSLHGVSTPLEPSSPDGEQSLVASIPMDALSSGPAPS